ncbi:MAG: DnaD domain protein [Lachnospiraceae bacterium]|nr:DnaD domain protein [Lachnospiraceae bacterium]
MDTSISIYGAESGYTLVSDIFIDKYMMYANEAQLKLYLYLLRQIKGGSFCISRAAEDLDYPERDVRRALEYWHKTGFLSLEYVSGELCAVRFLEPAPPAAPSGMPSESAVFVQSATSVDSSVFSGESRVYRAEKEAEAAPAPQQLPSSLHSAPPVENFYTKEQRESGEIREIMFIAETYLGKTLSVSDVNTILYIYYTLGFSAELIDYLIESCVGNGHRSMRYIESTALNWHESGINDIEAARERSAGYSRDSFAVLKAFGIRGRDPVPQEIDYLSHWKNDLGFDMNIILEAVRRTIQFISRPSFSYANTILENWHRENIRHLEDIKASDEKHKAAGANVSVVNGLKRGKDFNERSYDYGELERKFIKNQG